MRFLLPAVARLWAVFVLPLTLQATSIIPFVDPAEATYLSESVVLGRAVETIETTTNGATYQETRFETISSMKGSLLPGESFILRPLSRRLGKMNIAIAGDFRPETGKTYLLFLQKQGDFRRPLLLSFYVLEQFRKGTDLFLVPIQGSGIEILNRPDGQLAEPLAVFQQDSFLLQLRLLASGLQMAWNAAYGRTSFDRQDFVAAERAIPVGCDFNLGAPEPARWQNAAIPVYYDNTGNPANWGTKFGNILSALNTNYTGIDPSNAGSKAYVPDCGNGSAIEGNFLNFCDNNLGGGQCALFIFDDPCNEIDDLNGCAGVLAFGGSYSTGELHTFDGTDWDSALYGFVVVNNGVPACLSDQQYEQMLTHELTHVYRMGHLDGTLYPNQNMNPFCCNNINTKDKECMNYAYPAAAPVELLSYEVKALGDTKVQLKWSTQSEKNNAYFTVQRAGNGLEYKEMQQIPALGNEHGAAYEWFDSKPLAGLNYYLLSQTDFDGTLQLLGIKAVRLGRNQPVLRIYPNPLESQILGFSIESEADTEAKLEIIHADGRLLTSAAIELKKGAQEIRHPLEALAPGLYILRLSIDYQQFTARFIQR